jgi:alpha/beta superfamily hydrolase
LHPAAALFLRCKGAARSGARRLAAHFIESPPCALMSFDLSWPGNMSFRWTRGIVLLVALLFIGNGRADAGTPDTGAMTTSTREPEASVCGFIREPLAFWLFRRAAGSADTGRVSGIRDIERVTFTAGDGRILGGYRLRAQAPRGYLLVAPGNAMLADQIVDDLQYFRDLEFDVYVYDYRGYGLSQGKSRLAAIVADYREIISRLNAQGYRRRCLYGMSMGGIVLLNAVGESGDYSALVVDSSPSRISPLGCPEQYDPVNHLPADASRLEIIAGGSDRVVRPDEIQELLVAAKLRGAKVVQRAEYAHPFQDVSAGIRRQRFKDVADFIAR